MKGILGKEAENTKDAQKGTELEKTLSEIIELRLTDEEKTVLFKVYKDGKSLAEIAEEQSTVVNGKKRGCGNGNLFFLNFSLPSFRFPCRKDLCNKP